ncbi:hypothetical protein F2Q70_00038156 [Brassica cretica]|uniref:Uncharacterized protein n=1 Tax=Brassica cretica TaxID=69181 RepID=A0A8S9K9B9_BRACR|nr:hypothetical protein F2Q70_00038156 [Brassica cretica]
MSADPTVPSEPQDQVVVNETEENEEEDETEKEQIIDQIIASHEFGRGQREK